MKSPTLCIAFGSLFTALALTAAPVIDPGADRLLQDSCKYLADARHFTVNVEVWKDTVLPAGVKLQTTQLLTVQEARPDRLHIEVRSPRSAREFWLRKKSLTMLDRALNLYGVMETPEGFDKAFDAVEDRFGVELPLGDVLGADPYRSLMEHVESGDNLGKVMVLGTPCHHLAFTGPKADCQIWISDGAQPLPKKIVINFKTLTGSPQVTQIFSNWDLTSPISDSVFTFVPPSGAHKITVTPKADKTSAPAGAETPAAKPAKKQP